jgi:hypothetical protein
MSNNNPLTLDEYKARIAALEKLRSIAETLRTSDDPVLSAARAPVEKALETQIDSLARALAETVRWFEAAVPPVNGGYYQDAIGKARGRYAYPAADGADSQVALLGLTWEIKTLYTKLAEAKPAAAEQVDNATESA